MQKYKAGGEFGVGADNDGSRRQHRGGLSQRGYKDGYRQRSDTAYSACAKSQDNSGKTAYQCRSECRVYNMNGMTGIVIFLLTTLSGGATGMYFSGRLSERCRVINSYITLVQSMNCYIGFSGYKLAEIFRAEQKSSGCYISDKLVELSENGGDISDEWDICVSKSGYLKEDDRQILSELGRTIGKSNTDGETAVLALAGQRLSFQLKPPRRKENARADCTQRLG